MTPDESLVIRARAEQVFECKVAAIAWLKSPNMALNGQSPLDCCNTPEGRKAVLRVLNNIEYGNPV